MSSPPDDFDLALACEFCGIVSGRLPRTVRHEDDDLIVFHNEYLFLRHYWITLPNCTLIYRILIVLLLLPTPL